VPVVQHQLVSNFLLDLLALQLVLVFGNLSLWWAKALDARTYMLIRRRSSWSYLRLPRICRLRSLCSREGLVLELNMFMRAGVGEVSALVSYDRCVKA
jgi:hypothetical protein